MRVPSQEDIDFALENKLPEKVAAWHASRAPWRAAALAAYYAHTGGAPDEAEPLTPFKQAFLHGHRACWNQLKMESGHADE